LRDRLQGRDSEDDSGLSNQVKHPFQDH
jgi:hypothetical protein